MALKSQLSLVSGIIGLDKSTDPYRLSSDAWLV